MTMVSALALKFKSKAKCELSTSRRQCRSKPKQAKCFVLAPSTEIPREPKQALSFLPLAVSASSNSCRPWPNGNWATQAARLILTKTSDCTTPLAKRQLGDSKTKTSDTDCTPLAKRQLGSAIIQ